MLIKVTRRSVLVSGSHLELEHADARNRFAFAYSLASRMSAAHIDVRVELERAPLEHVAHGCVVLPIELERLAFSFCPRCGGALTLADLRFADQVDA